MKINLIHNNRNILFQDLQANRNKSIKCRFSLITRRLLVFPDYCFIKNNFFIKSIAEFVQVEYEEDLGGVIK